MAYFEAGCEFQITKGEQMSKTQKAIFDVAVCKHCGVPLGRSAGISLKCIECVMEENSELVERATVVSAGWLSRKNKREGLGCSYK